MRANIRIPADIGQEFSVITQKYSAEQLHIPEKTLKLSCDLAPFTGPPFCSISLFSAIRTGGSVVMKPLSAVGQPETS